MSTKAPQSMECGRLPPVLRNAPAGDLPWFRSLGVPTISAMVSLACLCVSARRQAPWR